MKSFFVDIDKPLGPQLDGLVVALRDQQERFRQQLAAIDKDPQAIHKGDIVSVVVSVGRARTPIRVTGQVTQSLSGGIFISPTSHMLAPFFVCHPVKSLRVVRRREEDTREDS